MTKIAAGKAPTSMRTSTLARSAVPAGEEPWTPICITSRLIEPIVCGDSWGLDFVGSGPSGLTLYQVETHASGELQSRLMIDSSLAIVQLAVDDGPGMLYFRSSGSLDDVDDHGKNGQVRSEQVSSCFSGSLYSCFFNGVGLCRPFGCIRPSRGSGQQKVLEEICSRELERRVTILHQYVRD